MIHTNSYGVPYRQGTFDDPKTKMSEPGEPGCHNCGEDDAPHDVEIPHPEGDYIVYYCNECYQKLFES